MSDASALCYFGGESGQTIGIESTTTAVSYVSVSALCPTTGDVACLISTSLDMFWLLVTSSAVAPTTTALTGSKAMNWTAGGTSAPLTIRGGVGTPKLLAYSTKPSPGGRFRVRKAGA